MAIKNDQELVAAIHYLHEVCHKMLLAEFHTYFPVCGNIGIFCHSPEEYEFLTNLRKTLTDESKSILGKYFLLHKPITIPANNGVPAATYTHLYIRKPDDTHPQVGDVDFYLPPEKYRALKQTFLDGKTYTHARIFPRADLDMIEILDPAIDAAVYIRTDEELTKR